MLLPPDDPLVPIEGRLAEIIKDTY